MYRLLPGLSDHQALSFNSSDVQRIMRWHRTGAETDRPARLRAAWMEEKGWPKGDFPSGYPSAPVVSLRIVEQFGDGLLASGSLVPVDIDGAKEDEYYLLLVEQVVDCLDLRRSSKPKKASGEVKKAVFRADALPVGLPAFRLPQFPRAVQWNGWAVERLTGLTGDEIEARLLWSEDPAAVPHPDPWGF